MAANCVNVWRKISWQKIPWRKVRKNLGWIFLSVVGFAFLLVELGFWSEQFEKVDLQADVLGVEVVEEGMSATDLLDLNLERMKKKDELRRAYEELKARILEEG